jgi:hypothetical protein
MGVLHEKNWPEKVPPSFLHEGRWGGGFLTLVSTKLVTLKSDKRLKVTEVRNCNAD